MNCIFKRIYLLMANKLNSSQLKHLCINDKYFKLKATKLSIYVLMANNLKSSQLKYPLTQIIIT